MYCNGREVPAVGVSIGVERVYAILEGQIEAKAKAVNRSIRQKQTQVYVTSVGVGYQVRSTSASFLAEKPGLSP